VREDLVDIQPFASPGTRRTILNSAAPVRDAEGRITGAVAAHMDITDLTNAQRALHESEAMLRGLFENLPELAWTARPDGYVDLYNRRWYEYTGTTPEAMRGWGWEDVHAPEVLPLVLERWRRSIATGEPFEMEYPLRGADGTFRSFLTRV